MKLQSSMIFSLSQTFNGFRRNMQKIQQVLNFFKLTQSNRVPSHLIDFSDFFKGDKILELLGFSFLNPCEKKSRKLHFIVSQFATFVIASLIFIKILVESNLNFFVTIECFFQCTELLVAIFDSFLLLIWKHGEIKDVLKILNSHFPHSQLDQYIFETRRFLKGLNFYEMLIKFLYLMVFIQFLSMPLIWLVYKFIKSEPLEWVVLFNIYLPFDQMQSVLYEGIFIFEVWASVMGLLAFMCTDLTFCSLVHILSMEFENLSKNIAEINPEYDDDAVMTLKEYIAIHQELLKTVEKIRNIFSFLLFIDVIGMVVIICLVCYMCLVKKEKK